MTINPHSTEWQIIKRYNSERIAKHRDELEALLVTPDRANQLRGMIAALREQLVFGEPEQAPEIKEPNYG
jgi:hypothetical protein